MLQPEKKKVKKALNTAVKAGEASMFGIALSEIPGAETLYDIGNVLKGLSEGDYKKIASNTIGALLPGVSGKAFEAVAEDWLPATPEIEKKKMQFNLQSSPADRQKYLKKYGPGYLNNPQFIKDQKLAYGTSSQGIMKKSMNPRKKYANGTNTAGVGPNNYIQSPNEVLNDYNIMLAKADLEVANNKLVPIVSMVGGLLQQGLSMAGSVGATGKSGLKDNAGALVDKAANPSTDKIMLQGAPGVVAANGMNNVEEDVEVEGGEMYETPQGEVGEFEGPSHEEGGIPLEVGQDVEEGTKVYSDRLKVGKETLAERKEKREKQIANLEKIASEPLVDSAVKNATKRKMEAIQREEMADLQFQEQINNMQAMADNVIKAFGTSVEGIQKMVAGGVVGDPPTGFGLRDRGSKGIKGVPDIADQYYTPEDFKASNNYWQAKLKESEGDKYRQRDLNNLEDRKEFQSFLYKDNPLAGKKGVEKSAMGDRNYDYTIDGVLGNTAHYTNNTLSSRSDMNNYVDPVTGDLIVKTDTPALPPLEMDYETPGFAEGFGVNSEGYTGDEYTGDPATIAAEEDMAFYTPGEVGTPIDNPEGTMLSRALGKAGKGLGNAATKVGTAVDKAGGFPGMGDLVGMFGNYLGANAGLKTAAEQRSSDITHRNVYANAGKESQKQLDTAMGAIENSKAQAIVKATTTTQGGKKSGRNSARGINAKRGMDWLYDTALGEQITAISTNAAAQAAEIYKAKSAVSLNADQMKGQGEYQANMANEASKDAYFTAKGLGRKDQALAVQHMGKDLNAMKQNKLIEKLMASGYGKHVGLDGKGNMTNANKTKATKTKSSNVEIPDGKGGTISMTPAEFQELMNKVTKTK